MCTRRRALKARTFESRPGSHYFALFFLVRTLRPLHIIESGCYKGLGSWVLRQAAGPQTRMTFISPEIPSLYVDRHNTTLHFWRDPDPHTRGDWSHFKDFNELPWGEMLSPQERERTLVFFDDHQAALRRAVEAKRHGFHHVVFDDNYLPNMGDLLALKPLCHADGRLWRLLGAKPTWAENFGRPLLHGKTPWYPLGAPLTWRQHASLVRVYNDTIRAYHELPPVWAGPNRFGVPRAWWDELTPAPLLDPPAARRFVQRHRLGLQTEARRYTHIVHVEV